MRKKYLSALLFGALLFASAGTFTSCNLPLVKTMMMTSLVCRIKSLHCLTD